MGYLVIERQSEEPRIQWFASKECLAKHFEESDLSRIDFIDEGSAVPRLMEWPSNTAVVFKGDFVVPKPRYVVDGIEVP